VTTLASASHPGIPVGVVLVIALLGATLIAVMLANPNRRWRTRRSKPRGLTPDQLAFQREMEALVRRRLEDRLRAALDEEPTASHAGPGGDAERPAGPGGDAERPAGPGGDAP
jgi:uncharacterized protein (DUF58 family)